MRNSLVAVFFLSTLLLTTQSEAQIMIEQGKIVIKANPGETIVNTLPIHNTSTRSAITLRAYWEDFSYIEPFTGDKEFVAAGTGDRSASRWFNFSPQQFTLESKGSKLISYSIQIPADAKGGYYGALFFEEGGGSPKVNVGVSVVTRIGALFFIETTNSTRTGNFANLKYSDNSFSGEFINTGDTVLIPDSTFYILNEEGLVAERGEITKFYLAAGKKANVSFNAAETLDTGHYTAVLTFDFGGGDSSTYEFDFSKNTDGGITIL